VRSINLKIESYDPLNVYVLLSCEGFCKGLCEEEFHDVEAARLFMRSRTARLAKSLPLTRCNTDQLETQSRPRQDFKFCFSRLLDVGARACCRNCCRDGSLESQ